MEAVKLPGMNRDLAPPQGWDAEKDGECTPLPVFAEVHNGSVLLTSAWKPNAEELEHLNKGGAVALVIYGTMHPPVALGVFPADVSAGAVPLTGEGGVAPSAEDVARAPTEQAHEDPAG